MYLELARQKIEGTGGDALWEGWNLEITLHIWEAVGSSVCLGCDLWEKLSGGQMTKDLVLN